MDAVDLLTFAASRGMLDAQTARTALGSAEPTVARLVQLGLIKSDQAATLLREFQGSHADTLRIEDASPQRCPRCTRRMRIVGQEAVCEPCHHREPRASAPAPVTETQIEMLPPEVRAALSDPKARFGHYVKMRKLGQGGFGTVYKAWDLALRRVVALKVLQGESPDEVARFKREARMVAGIAHANIAAVYEVGEVEAEHFIAFQFIDGETLARLRLSPREALEAMAVAARAVAYAHKEGIIHRDLKPHNIMRREDGVIFVLDFGLAKSTAPDSKAQASQALVGTPAYMSPEQAGGRPADARSDVYGLGAVLYELLTAQPPYVGENPMAILRQVTDSEPIRPSRLNPRLDRDTETCLLKAMDKDPSRRYESALALAEDLERHLKGEAIQAHPASLVYQVSKQVKRNPFGWAGGGAVALLVVVSAATGLGTASAAALVVTVALLGSLAAVSFHRGRRHAVRGRALAIYQEAESWYREAMAHYMEEGRPDSKMMDLFESKLSEAKREDPTFDKGWFERAQFFRLTGDEEKAWESLNEGLKREPEHPMGRMERGLLMAGRYKRELAKARATMITEEVQKARAEGRSPRPISTAEVESRQADLGRMREDAVKEIKAGALAQPRHRWVKVMLKELEDLLDREE